MFHTFILSNFYFCPLAWHFCTEKNSKKLEKIQERGALRFVNDDYSSSSESLLENVTVPTLQVRRIRTMAFETSKILHNLAPVCLQNLLHTKNSKYYLQKYRGCTTSKDYIR